METFRIISILLCGFSVFSALLLSCAYLFLLPQLRKTITSRFSCVFLLSCLLILELYHANYFLNGVQPDLLRSYAFILILAPTGFYLFSREILFPERPYTWLDGLHALPMLASFWIPTKFIPACAFIVGTAYTLWLVGQLWQFREQRSRFKFELFFFVLFSIMAVVALVFGLLMGALGTQLFYYVYSAAISISFILVVAALICFPELLEQIQEIVDTYANSKLSGINQQQKIAALDRLMIEEKAYQNENLSLAVLAEQIDLNSHQLSELINTQFKFGFSKYVRQHRVNAAKKLLIEQPDVSILAISMETGFNSQSNFYAAFKEITGQSPGQFRKHP